MMRRDLSQYMELEADGSGTGLWVASCYRHPACSCSTSLITKLASATFAPTQVPTSRPTVGPTQVRRSRSWRTHTSPPP